MYYDKSKNCLWLHSSTNIYQLSINNEDSEIWKAHLEREDFDQALEFCEKRNREYVKKVARLYANSLFEKKNYYEAASIYSKSDEFLEEVALKFLISGQDEVLNCKNIADFSLFGKNRRKIVCRRLYTEMYDKYMAGRNVFSRNQPS